MELVLAVVALVLSVASLIWQIASHVLSGDRVVVSEGTAMPVGGIDYLPTCRSITAANRGRTAVTVTSIALDVGANQFAQVAMHIVPQLSSALPVRLDPGDSASWAFPLSVDEEVRRAHPGARAVVGLATGRTRRAKRR